MAQLYWTQVKKGYDFGKVHASLQDDVKTLAKADVVLGKDSGGITEAEYKSYIGEKYVA